MREGEAVPKEHRTDDAQTVDRSKETTLTWHSKNTSDTPVKQLLATLAERLPAVARRT
jgi:hypothetical protein